MATGPSYLAVCSGEVRIIAALSTVILKREIQIWVAVKYELERKPQ